MKFSKSKSKKFFLLGYAGACFILGMNQADPTDDFSFSLHSSGVRSYSLLSEQRVTEVLRERLDLFPVSETPRLARHLIRLCRETRFDPAFILSMIEVESRFRIRIESPAGAIGLMQVMPATATVVARTFLGERADRMDFQEALQDPFLNLQIGITYLAWLRDKYRDLSPFYLVAAYNAGPAKIDGLLSRKSFKPVNTKRYYEAIRRGLPGLRLSRRVASEV